MGIRTVTDDTLFDSQNAAYAQAMFEEYARNPESVSVEWRRLFDNGGTLAIAEGLLVPDQLNDPRTIVAPLAESIAPTAPAAIEAPPAPAAPAPAAPVAPEPPAEPVAETPSVPFTRTTNQVSSVTVKFWLIVVS